MTTSYYVVVNTDPLLQKKSENRKSIGFKKSFKESITKRIKKFNNFFLKSENQQLVGFKKKSVRRLTIRFDFFGLKPNRRHHYKLCIQKLEVLLNITELVAVQ